MDFTDRFDLHLFDGWLVLSVVISGFLIAPLGTGQPSGAAVLDGTVFGLTSAAMIVQTAAGLSSGRTDTNADLSHGRAGKSAACPAALNPGRRA